MHYNPHLPAVEYSPEKCCRRCGNGWRTLVEQRPHPLFGALGMTIDTFRCVACGKTIVE
ncbi:MAG: hypothetical protein ACOY4R_07190 [Pseudomonadota bacterium]